MKASSIVFGILFGALMIATANYFGEQIYSDAIRECILEKGTNK